MVDGGLVNYGSGVVGFDPELKPCPSRQTHFGSESQQLTLHQAGAQGIGGTVLISRDAEAGGNLRIRWLLSRECGQF
jgi:hypothetical protein